MNNTYYSGIPYSESLQHYGVPGMKWGVRRYQNKDGTRTTLGKKRYRKGGDLYSDSSKPKKSSTKVTGRNTEVSGNATRRLAEGIVRGMKQKLAEKFPYMLNDEEIEKYTNRQRSENAYLTSRGDKRIAKQRGKQDSYMSTLAKNTLNSVTRIAVDKTMNKAMDRLLETENEKELREAKTERNKYEESSNAALNRLYNTISSNDEANEEDHKTLLNNQDRAQKLLDKIEKRSVKYKTTNAVDKKRLLAQNASDLIKMKKLTKHSEQLRKNIDKRAEENERSRKSISSTGFDPYSNKGKGGKGVSEQRLREILDEVLNQNS